MCRVAERCTFDVRVSSRTALGGNVKMPQSFFDGLSDKGAKLQAAGVGSMMSETTVTRPLQKLQADGCTEKVGAAVRPRVAELKDEDCYPISLHARVKAPHFACSARMVLQRRGKTFYYLMIFA